MKPDLSGPSEVPELLQEDDAKKKSRDPSTAPVPTTSEDVSSAITENMESIAINQDSKY